jgi:hypothetical protein
MGYEIICLRILIGFHALAILGTTIDSSIKFKLKLINIGALIIEVLLIFGVAGVF